MAMASRVEEKATKKTIASHVTNCLGICPQCTREMSRRLTISVMLMEVPAELTQPLSRASSSEMPPAISTKKKSIGMITIAVASANGLLTYFETMRSMTPPMNPGRQSTALCESLSAFNIDVKSLITSPVLSANPPKRQKMPINAR
ncbi:unnamed protein product [Peronospora belbahrii]|uniref:Uncharacterized protein n=1 Tax=Peronospora belbahrii TaxID=622444 RepID=A0AAU9KQW3_9STRA|nr:unnamed protein product [Peronospora belbahrii]CAH0521621.1 unnamed protein product [Peronospora belbahrii]